MSIINKGVYDAGKVFILQTGNDWPTSQTTTADVTEASSNLYFTNARVIAAVSSLTTANITEASGNLYFTNTRVVQAVNPLLTTANVLETTNQYFTNTRVVSALIAGDYVTIEANGRISANVGTVTVQAATQVNNLDNLTTANLAEGTNLYFTNTRARTAYTAGKGINIDGQGVIKNTGRTPLFNTDINGTGGGNVLSTMSTILTLPSVPSTDRYLLRSLLVVNLSDTTSYVSGNILYATGNTASFANQIPVAAGGLLEFVKTGQILQPGDKINLQGFNSSSVATSNVLNAMYTYESFDNDATYIGLGQTITTSNTNTVIYDSFSSYSIVESIKIVNVGNNIPRVKVFWADANNVPKVYLAYNTPIPTNSSVELITTAKRLEITDKLIVSYDNAEGSSISTFVSARLGVLYSIGSYTASAEVNGSISATFSTTDLDGTILYYSIE